MIIFISDEQVYPLLTGSSSDKKNTMIVNSVEVLPSLYNWACSSFVYQFSASSEILSASINMHFYIKQESICWYHQCGLGFTYQSEQKGKERRDMSYWKQRNSTGVAPSWCFLKNSSKTMHQTLAIKYHHILP